MRQAIRWGYQEREFSRFEASLARQATLGELIAWARQRQGRSLHEVSEHAGLSEGLLRDLEKGGLSPLEVAPEKMARLARTLDVSIWTMLERVPPAAVPANGASSPHERILPDAAAPAADAIWSAGARHRKPRSETVALKEPAPAPRAQKQAADYRAALRKAWHRHDQEPPTE
ncbi:MAG: helix-turn-helix transcriptional regulator [Armatimonadetes bacterium]|nr:helix-turn-helix transcriptional regulator [Armatimonadota bacterium]